MRALEERRGEQGQMSQRGQGEWSIEENVLGPCKKGSSRRHFLPASGNSGYYETGHRWMKSYCFFSKNKIVC